MQYMSVCPWDEKLIDRYEYCQDSQLERSMEGLQLGYDSWRHTELTQRLKKIKALAKSLSLNKEELAGRLTLEMGKLRREAVSEIEKCVSLCDYYFDSADASLKSQSTFGLDKKAAELSFEPLGIILGVMPWNFPVWQVFRFAIPAMLVGNVVAMKPAPNVAGCAQIIQKLFDEVFFEQKVFSSLLLSNEQVAKLLVDPRVAGLSFTGSAPVGAKLSSLAASSLKKSVLELGGSDAYLICDDADLGLALELTTKARLINAGQSCISPKRLLISIEVYEDFKAALLARLKKLSFGDPRLESTELAPMARQDIRKKLHEQVQSSISLGAKCLLGGCIPEGPGYFYPCTVLENLSEGMPAFEEELFGPVFSLIKVGSEQEAIAIANTSKFGLGAAVFSQDLAKAEQLASKLEAGLVAINNFVRSDPSLPFGGIKHSGFGRELGSWGLYEFANVKTRLS